MAILWRKKIYIKQHARHKKKGSAETTLPHGLDESYNHYPIDRLIIDTNSLYDKTKNHQTQQQPQQQKIRQPANNKTVQKSSSIDQYEYASLYRLGLEVIENNGYLIVTGDDIFSKKDSIKACGFHWDSKSKSWYKPIQQAA